MKLLLHSGLRSSFYCFLQKSFTVVNPVAKFSPNWHLGLVCDALELCAAQKLKRLIINVPPRSLKSVCVSAAFPAWILGLKPYSRIIVSTHSGMLTLRHASDCRRIMNVDWYKDVFPETELKLGENRKEKFATTKNGYYFATSVDGTLLGEGGDVLIVDDPQRPEDVFSKKMRMKTIDWFQNTLLSRLNDKKAGVVILVMQRLHEDDLCGFLLKNHPNWHHISLPAISEADHDVVFFDKFYFHREKNNVLHNERETLEMLSLHRSAIGLFAFAAQYQQSPVSVEGNLIRMEWIRFYKAEDLPSSLRVCISVDCASGVGNKNDYTAIVIIGCDDQKHFVLDVIRERLKYPDLKRVVLGVIKQTNPFAIIVENTSNGSSLIQDLEFEHRSILFAVKPKKNKVARFNHAMMAIESGLLLFPSVEASFMPELTKELLSFPLSEHDDQVDAISQYFTWSHQRSVISKVPKIRMV